MNSQNPPMATSLCIYVYICVYVITKLLCILVKILRYNYYKITSYKINNKRKHINIIIIKTESRAARVFV